MATSAQTQQDIDIQIAHLERELLELKRQRNDLSPISAIPPEILCQILLLATSHPQDEKEFIDLHEGSRIERYIGTLCHVSHTWRTISLGCPQLWAEIDIRTATDKRQVDFMLDLAHPLPISLHVNLKAKAPQPAARQYAQLNALDSVTRVLSGGVPFNKLALSGSLNLLTELLQNARPTTLQTLHIVVTDRRSLGYTAAGASIAQHPIFKRGAPELRALTVEGCAIPLTSPILLLSPHLTSLCMHVQRDSRADQVLDVLKAIRQVQQLNFDFRGPFLASQISLDPVHLPYLSRTYLRGDSDSILTIVSNIRFSARAVSVNLACAFRDQSRMPTFGAMLFKVIGQARCPPESIRHIVPLGGAFSPDVLGLGSPHLAPNLGHICYLTMGNWMTVPLVRDAPSVPSTEVSIMFFDQRTSSSFHWTKWHPLVLAKNPKDLRLMTGWCLDALAMVGFMNDDANYPEPFWGFLSECPQLLELGIAHAHMSKLVPHLSADNGGLPFPSLCRMSIQEAISRDAAARSRSVAGPKYEVDLESLLEGLRKRQSLCRKYGISKKWMLDELLLDSCISTPSTQLLNTARAEGLIGQFSRCN